MKEKKLFEAFSEVDDDLVADAAPMKKASPHRRRSVLLIAACFVLIVSSCLTVFLVMQRSDVTPIVTTTKGGETAPEGTSSQTQETAPEGTSSQTQETASAVSTEETANVEGDVDVDDAYNKDTYYKDAYIEGGNSYTEIKENDFVFTAENNTSYFSIDASTASFPNIRSTLKKGYLPAKDAVRVEEILNYFKYDYAAASGDDILALNAALFDCPYNSELKLFTVGLAAEEVVFSEIANNLVFLIDVSGSMNVDNKLPLVQQAFTMLAENLNPTDRVSIVTYAGRDQVALSGAYGYEKARITAVIEDLAASGSTAGSAGITTAYSLAQQYFIEGGNNRVILMTDGDFNVGISSTSALESFIAEKRDTGVYFSVYGFGEGNWKSDKMEALALSGNGIYSYIDSVSEAKRALVEDIGGSIVTVAKDVKAGVVFNPAYVESYRLVGYETKQLTQDQFEDSATDAGELGSGHTVTVVYEIKLTDAALDEEAILGEVTLKYKTPYTNEDKETRLPVSSSVYHAEMTEQDAFIASVVEFALLLRDSAYKGDATVAALVARLDSLKLDDEYKAEFRDVVKLYAAIVEGDE